MTIASGSRVSASDGRILTLGKLMKSGGAGSIYRIGEAAELVAKIYHPHVDHAVYEHKVEAMLTLAPDLPDIDEGGVREVQMAWPRLLLRDPRRQFLGFAMPLLDFATSAELECVLQERQARAEGLPTGLGAKVTLAANLAGVIAELHRQGHYVVDLKPVNLRFYRRSLHVTMLDCDGCSIQGKGRRFRAPQFTPEYLAPEFHGRGFSTDEQSRDEESQDRFALAVVAFQLLNFGIHPFTGRPTSDSVATDIPGRIAQRCYAYGVRPNPKMAPNLASGHAAMPLQVRQLFDRAFEGSARPSASEWVNLLRDYGQRSSGKLSKCQANAEHEYFTGQACAACARAALLTNAAAAARSNAHTGQRRIGEVASRGRGSAARAGRRGRITITWAKAPVPHSRSQIVHNQQGHLLGIGLLLCCLGIPLCLAMLHKDEGKATYLVPSQRPPEQRKLEPTTSLADVLAAANSGDKHAIDPQLLRLPSRRTTPKDLLGSKCQAAFAAWNGKTTWINSDRAFAKDEVLQFHRRKRVEKVLEVEAVMGGPCTDLYRASPAILRIVELCTLRLRSPGTNPGTVEDACRANGVVQAGLDALQASVIFEGALQPLRWEYLAQAFLMAGDRESAYASFVVSAKHYKEIGLPLPPFVALHEPWLRERAEILAARASAKISEWSEVPVSDEVAEMLSRPWPKEPPPDIPAPARNGRKRATHPKH